jgi:hypothetical protein
MNYPRVQSTTEISSHLFSVFDHCTHNKIRDGTELKNMSTKRVHSQKYTSKPGARIQHSISELKYNTGTAIQSRSSKQKYISKPGARIISSPKSGSSHKEESTRNTGISQHASGKDTTIKQRVPVNLVGGPRIPMKFGSQSESILTTTPRPALKIGGGPVSRKRPFWLKDQQGPPAKVKQKKSVSLGKQEHDKNNEEKAEPLTERAVIIDQARHDPSKIDSTLYILTHLHKDHIPSNAAEYKIFCSQETKCISQEKGVQIARRLRGLDVGKKYTFSGSSARFVDNRKPVTFWLFPAWHCDGSVMVLYMHGKETKNAEFFLNTGDFRYDLWGGYSDYEETTQQIKRILTGAKNLHVFYDSTFISDENQKFPDQFPTRETSVTEIRKWVQEQSQKPVTIVKDELNSALAKSIHMEGVLYTGRGGTTPHTAYIDPTARGALVQAADYKIQPDFFTKDKIFYSDHGSRHELDTFVAKITEDLTITLSLEPLTKHPTQSLLSISTFTPSLSE